MRSPARWFFPSRWPGRIPTAARVGPSPQTTSKPTPPATRSSPSPPTTTSPPPSAADLLVFAQPIAHDTIHNFDAGNDKIDLIGFGAAQFGDLSIADDANGNAVVTTSPGSTITVLGVHAADLGAANFEFNVEPMMANTGTMTISDGAILPLGGVIDNSGTIALGSTGSETDLEILVESVTLQGGGHVALSDDDSNVIFGGAANATLINVDNTISGAGQIGAGQMTLVNAGTIVADGSHALVIDTGSNAVVNSGTLAATGSGGLVVDSALANTGACRPTAAPSTCMATSLAMAAHIGNAARRSAHARTRTSLARVPGGSARWMTLRPLHRQLTGFGDGDSLTWRTSRSAASTTLSYTANAPARRGMLTIERWRQHRRICADRPLRGRRLPPLQGAGRRHDPDSRLPRRDTGPAGRRRAPTCW